MSLRLPFRLGSAAPAKAKTSPQARLHPFRQRSGKPVDLPAAGRIGYRGLFTVEAHGAHHLVRAGGAPLFVSGLPVHEKILEPGDRIEAGGEAFEFRPVQAGLPAVMEWLSDPVNFRRSVVVLLAAALLLAAGGQLLIRGIARDEARKEAEAQEPAVPPASLTASQQIAIARMRLETVTRLLAETGVAEGNLARAARTAGEALEEFPLLPRDSETYRLLVQAEAAASARLQDRLLYLKRNAVTAKVAGRADDFHDLLLQVVAAQPDPRDPSRVWALQQLLAIQIPAAKKADKAGVKIP